MPFLADAAGPGDMRLYAIGDIHGRLDLLREMHARVAADLVRRPCRRFRVIHLGDYIDRGPDSAGVVEHLIEFNRDGDGVCLAGNHDLYLLRFLDDPSNVGPTWLDNGGDAALASWGIDVLGPDLRKSTMRAIRDAFAAVLPLRHRTFFEQLSFSERHGDFLFVHAGIRPGAPLDRQKTADLTFIRQPFLDSEADHGVVVVHGHTATNTPTIRPNRIGIDTRAYASGVLTCLVIDGSEKGFLGPDGVAPLAF
ncbi:MAG: serine/threonine protein phosphatase [Rhodobacteraceae bacterium]|nr:MAG: serine/threonine protein phosphatase [Paracoccaceae bacterium]